MKPNDLKSPFPRGESRAIIIHDRVWYVPEISEPNPDFIFPGWEHPDLFGNENPVHVEYCSGNGTWIAEKALQNPHINWLAVEIKFTRVRKIWSKLKNYRLNNLVVLCGEGMQATHSYFPDRSVSHVFVNFPDPWPKRRHAKNRLIQTPFIEQVKRISIDGGELTLVTDDPDYSLQMVETVMESQSFIPSFPEPHYQTENSDYGTSYFDSLWRNQGREIRYHHFRMSPNPSEKCSLKIHELQSL